MRLHAFADRYGLRILYLRVSTTDKRQTVENQKLAISEYCRARKLHVDDWIEAKASSRRDIKQRRIPELMNRLKSGDLLIVSELSRLAQSVAQIAILDDSLPSGMRSA